MDRAALKTYLRHRPARPPAVVVVRRPRFHGSFDPLKLRIGPKPEQGFTLLEVVTAVFVFLVGVVGVISLFAAATAFHKGARDKTLSALVIGEVLCEIQDRLARGDFQDQTGLLKSKVEGAIRGSERYGYQVEFVERDVHDNSLIQAKIRVTWQDKGVLHGEAFDYLFRSGQDYNDTVTSLIRGAR